MLGSVYESIKRQSVEREKERLIMPGVPAEAGMKGQLAWEEGEWREEGRSGRGRGAEGRGRGRKSSCVHFRPPPTLRFICLPLCVGYCLDTGRLCCRDNNLPPGSSNSRRKVDLGSGQHSVPDLSAVHLFTFCPAVHLTCFLQLIPLPSPVCLSLFA